MTVGMVKQLTLWYKYYSRYVAGEVLVAGYVLRTGQSLGSV